MATDNLTPIVRSNVRKAMEAKGETLSSLERATGLSRSKLRTRIFGHSAWSTTEIALMAVHFDTTPDALCTEQAA